MSTAVPLPKPLVLSLLLAAAAAGPGSPAGRLEAQATRPHEPWVIAHRGASAYAPENTIPAFQLAVQQGATFVEFDLQLTKDRQIVCLHDESLERTTDVEAVFPDRFREVTAPKPGRRWMLSDFTLAEIKRLDAGAWFDQKFRGTRIPTFSETIEAVKGRTGLFIELKSPERYEGIERLVLAELKAHGLDRPKAEPKSPVLIQSFSAPSLERFAAFGSGLPIHFLVSAREAGPWLTAEGMGRLKAFTTGISPEKTALTDREIVSRAHAAGLLVAPYTFRASAVSGFPDVRAEMAHYLGELGVDGVITDNPDLVPVPQPR